MTNPLNGIDLIGQTQQIPGKQHTGQTVDQDRLKKTCQEFESLFVSQMMQQMRRTIPEDGIIGRSQAEKIYTGLLDNEIAKTVSQRQGVGLARMMYEQMAAIQSTVPKKK
jgi:flagellar protein FlgJ